MEAQTQTPPFNIILNIDDADDLKIKLTALVSEAVETAKRNTTSEKEYLKGKKAMREYLGNISEAKFNELHVPMKDLSGVYVIRKRDLDKFIADNF
ncbi:hypothetical protein [Fructilactobacillus frigidiflavus]|uniref:hypothetical protein n=1 Tax=Fructilactobacillus frigidiflavus TaxID=3242688 RepID=UPI003756C600